MPKFAIKDISSEALSKAAKCETPKEVQELLASLGLDSSDEAAQKLFDYTRFVELDENELENVAGGCDTEESATSSQADCDEQQS